MELVPTFLGAHSVPPEFHGNREAYVRLLIDEMLPEIARRRLAEFCDVFCEQDVFSVAESERILETAHALGLQLKVHADELSPLGGAELAGRLQARSADHLLCVTDAGIEALAKSGTVATLLPGTAFFRDQMGNRFLRFCFAVEDQLLSEACDRLVSKRLLAGDRSTCATITIMGRQITQRELRNESGRIMWALDKGQSFIVTRNGG